MRRIRSSKFTTAATQSKSIFDRIRVYELPDKGREEQTQRGHRQNDEEHL